MKTQSSQGGFAPVAKTALVFFAVGVLLAGCASDPEIYSFEQVPSYIREFKRLKLYAHVEKKDTKIDLTAGEYVSIMVNGTIRRWKNAPPADSTYRTIAKWINRGWHSLFYHVNGGTFESLTTGRLS